VRYEDDRWRFWLGVGLALIAVAVGWSFRSKLPDRVQIMLREPGHAQTPRFVLPGVRQPLYARNDDWLAYLAPEAVCPGGEELAASVDAQERTMVCLINFARRHAGLQPLALSKTLSFAASLKVADIVRCRDFAHAACGKDPHAVADEAGYPEVSWGENLYFSTGPRGAPRPALDGWLNSPHHRENLLDGRWREQGIALIKAKAFSHGADAAVWASQFGAP
jgi:uncharacterized protein YkwD